MNSPELFCPEFALLLGALLSFACAAIGTSARTAWMVSLAAAIIAVGTSALALPYEGQPFFADIYTVDAFSQVLKLGISMALLFAIAIAQRQDSTCSQARPEVHFFFYLSSLGMMMLVSATELLTLYVALELSAYGLYILAALHRRERIGSEAAAKYILFGAAASAISLYGISLIYGATQTTYIAQIASSGGSPLLIAGIVLTLAGVLYKLAAFPVHAWAPDTYQGAPHEASVFLGTASKVAAVGLLLRVLSMAGSEAEFLRTTLIVVSVLSMSVGNLSALFQKDFKRLLGFSAVAHAGYLLLGLLCFSKLGAAAAIFYVLTYVPIVVCAFLVISAISTNGCNPSIASLAGLYKRSPLLGLVLLVAMFGLAGIPPTPGLAGKWFLFSAVIENGHLWLVLVAAINATISLYYYLMVVKAAYLAPPEDDEGEIRLSPTYAITAFVAIALVVFMGFYPAPIWTLASTAASALF
ncbi:MAG: NADH-quinone oxidoreductase subunit N [Myxococcales bacterium]|nr:NADH-quinone oxidoreductase subunit N [Myxococcales bacterium]